MDPQIAEKLKIVEQKQAELAELQAKGNTTPPPGAVSKMGGPLGGATEPTDKSGVRVVDGVQIVGDVFELSDPHKGKGLKLATAARMVALGGTDKSMALHFLSKQPYGEVYKKQVEILIEKAFVEKALGESTLTGGGALIPDPLAAEFIEVLRPSVVMYNAPGVIKVPMSTLALTFARQSAAATAAWLGESQNITATAPTFDNVQLSLKKLGAQVALSNDLLRDNAIAADMIVRQDLVAVAVRALDLAMIRGSGTAYQPKGLLNWISSGNQFGSNVGSGSVTLALILQDLWQAIRLVRAANVPFDANSAFWLFSPRTEAGLAQQRDGVGRPYFADEMANGRVLGYRYLTTTQIPENLSGGGSGGSAESEIYFVVGPQCLQGEGLTPTIQVVPQGAYYDGSAVQSGLSRDETVISIVLRADFAMRHPLGGARIKGVVYGS
jgi:HK97 family phage major capsid protein